MQSAPHRVVGAGQLHTPPEHAVPEGQAIPQAPQFPGSPIRSTHAPAHLVLVPEQVDVQEPLSQTRQGGQVVPHVPQLEGSEEGSTQPPEQRMAAAGQTHAPSTQRKLAPHS